MRKEKRMKEMNKKYAVRGIASVMLMWMLIFMLPVLAKAEEKTEGRWKYEVNEDGQTVTITKYRVWFDERDATVEIPAKLEGKDVIAIGNEAFYIPGDQERTAKYIKEIIIPDGVKRIDHAAFMNCTELEKINIPDSVQYIGSSAFLFCENLKGTIVLPNSITQVEYSTFSECKQLQNVIIPDSVTTIDEDAFNGCSNLSQIELPNTLTEIGSSVFTRCKKITNIKIPNSVVKIGKAAFAFCENLIEIELPEGITNIESNTFTGCTNLQEVHLPESLTFIDFMAFRECTSLDNIIIPKGVDNIYYAFDNSICLNVYQNSYAHQYAIDNNFKYRIIGGTVSTPDQPETPGIDAPSNSNNSNTGWKKPGETVKASKGTYKVTDAKEGNSTVTYLKPENQKVKNISIPANITVDGVTYKVTAISAKAFYQCNRLTKIVIPASVEKIGKQAFSECKKLKSITIKSQKLTAKNVGSKAFKEIHQKAVIKVPKAKLKDYKKLLKAKGVGKKVKIKK